MGISAAAAFSNTEKEVKLIPSTKVFYAKGTHAIYACGIMGIIPSPVTYYPKRGEKAEN